MTAMINAMRVLTIPSDTGAVAICLPQDVQGETYDYPDYFFAEKIYRIERTGPTPEMVREAAELIRRKEKPLLICGGGVRYSGAGEALAAFADDFNIPFAETQAGKSAVVAGHELNLGGIGTTGNLSANLIARKADLVIGVGTRMSDFTTASKSLFLNQDVEFLSINIGSFDAHKMDSVVVQADARKALGNSDLRLETVQLPHLLQKMKSGKLKKNGTWNGNACTPWNIAAKILCPRCRVIWTNSSPSIPNKLDTRLTQTQVLAELNLMLEDDSIVVGSSGSLPGCMQRMWNSRSTDTYNMEYGYSCMGYEICAALGAQDCPAWQGSVFICRRRFLHDASFRTDHLHPGRNED